MNISADYKDECVILLHGLGDVKLSMNKLEYNLRKAGYSTKNVGYDSNDKKIELISEEDLASVIKQCKYYKKIHFVTHSMGGLIVRYYLQNNKLPNGSRLVMLSPPNKGSGIADYFENSKIYELFYGKVGKELQTDSQLIHTLSKIDYEVGIIAGNKSTNPFFSSILQGEDDGRVAVENMKLDEMIDFIIIPTTHLLIKYNNDVAKQTILFLKNGKFDHPQK
ncbi:MAG: alpha/beta hydrolase [Candidatus Cloacimonetes bacterium]|nr:alpha/beta hydrolase [Candidatus Cloacimonadota bacterium]